ncbi:uncharacterized protein G6M90_00g017220 [Metarhizium brunneum]|uniref:Uncharacterized protein n=1 Tax=Metarhizium brunneum TaxID=500148 RepID=A0A7D5YVX4_9HYPO|nr:hypothetical protein G6M90_00g017220 [Metarhizium brunneum]
MAAWHLPGWATLARTAARGAAWATDVAAIVVLCFVAQKWTATCGAVAPGIIGAVIALLSDSWQMVAFADRRLGVAPTKPHRTLMHDVFSLAVTLGGVALMLVSNVPGGEGRDPASHAGDEGPGAGGIALRRSTMAWLGLWLLTVIIVFRVGFAAWSCADCYKEYQRDERHASRRADAEQGP